MPAVVPSTSTRSPSDGVLECLERGRANVVRCALEASGAQVDVVSGTITISDGAGAVVVDAAAVTVTSGVASYSYTPPSTTPLGDGWLIVWALTTASGSEVVRRSAAVCRVALRCPIGVADLYDELGQINPAGAAPSTGETEAEHDRKIEAAWRRIQADLVGAGRRPFLVIDSQALRGVVIDLALALILEDSRGLAQQLRELGGARRRAYEAAWGKLQLRYDEDDVGVGSVPLSSSRPAFVALCGLDR